jgi:hypothetical protein
MEQETPLPHKTPPYHADANAEMRAGMALAGFLVTRKS